MKKYPRLTQLALDFLDNLGNKMPNADQQKIMHSLLCENAVINKLLLDKRLTDRDIACLYLAAQGRNIAETAAFLKVSEETVKKYRKEIIKKLGCRTIIQVAFTTNATSCL